MDEAAASLACLRCTVPMELGFVPDRTNTTMASIQTWVAGAPERSTWTGIKLKGRQLIPVMTYRCPRCGYIESRAVVPSPDR